MLAAIITRGALGPYDRGSPKYAGDPKISVGQRTDARPASHYASGACEQGPGALAMYLGVAALLRAQMLSIQQGLGEVRDMFDCRCVGLPSDEQAPGPPEEL